jgi:hypothetical protein
MNNDGISTPGAKRISVRQNRLTGKRPNCAAFAILQSLESRAGRVWG